MSTKHDTAAGCAFIMIILGLTFMGGYMLGSRSNKANVTESVGASTSASSSAFPDRNLVRVQNDNYSKQITRDKYGDISEIVYTFYGEILNDTPSSIYGATVSVWMRDSQGELRAVVSEKAGLEHTAPGTTNPFQIVARGSSTFDWEIEDYLAIESFDFTVNWEDEPSNLYKGIVSIDVTSSESEIMTSEKGQFLLVLGEMKNDFRRPLIDTRAVLTAYDSKGRVCGVNIQYYNHRTASDYQVLEPAQIRSFTLQTSLLLSKPQNGGAATIRYKVQVEGNYN